MGSLAASCCRAIPGVLIHRSIPHICILSCTSLGSASAVACMVQAEGALTETQLVTVSEAKFSAIAICTASANCQCTAGQDQQGDRLSVPHLETAEAGPRGLAAVVSAAHVASRGSVAVQLGPQTCRLASLVQCNAPVAWQMQRVGCNAAPQTSSLWSCLDSVARLCSNLPVCPLTRA